MITLLYTLIILIATTAGALGGLGGGVIIKPLLLIVALKQNGLKIT